MTIHLFGASTPVGESFCRKTHDDVIVYSRNPSKLSHSSAFADLSQPDNFHPAPALGPSVWISFAPIWLFGPFLSHLECNYPERLQGVVGIIACSSSSVITKRFASNEYDRALVAQLFKSEELIISSCTRLSIHCSILQPSLIYGKVGPYSDKNLSLIAELLRRFRFIPFPSRSGLRQPIHASQLASVSLHFVDSFLSSKTSPFSQRILLGGDTILSYADMIKALIKAQPKSDPIHKSLIFPVPNRLFFLFVSPLLAIYPRYFEALIRIGADLSDFVPAHKITGSAPVSFPITFTD